MIRAISYLAHFDDFSQIEFGLFLCEHVNCKNSPDGFYYYLRKEGRTIKIIRAKDDDLYLCTKRISEVLLHQIQMYNEFMKEAAK